MGAIGPGGGGVDPHIQAGALGKAGETGKAEAKEGPKVDSPMMQSVMSSSSGTQPEGEMDSSKKSQLKEGANTFFNEVFTQSVSSASIMGISGNN